MGLVSACLNLAREGEAMAVPDVGAGIDKPSAPKKVIIDTDPGIGRLPGRD